MYPLWVRREQLAPIVEEVPVRELTAENSQVAAKPNPPQSPLAPARGTPEGSPFLRSDPSAVRGEDNPLSSSSPDEATSHSTKPASGQVAGYDKGRLGGVEGLDWPELKSTVHSCQACALRAGCIQPVFGMGDEKANWLFVGDAPDADDDAQGEPFAGQAGKLLDNMLTAIKLKRHNVYLTHAIKCRPVDDRHPHVAEIAQCLPYLQRQIALIQPKVIVALGKVASNALLGNDATLASLRGTPHDYQGIPLIVTYHPSYLLRSPSEKAKAWQDLCLAVALMQTQS
jgi:uracil-DNA glycosylase